MKRTGSRTGPQMPAVSELPPDLPVELEVGEPAGEDRQCLLQLGPRQRGAQAVVDAGPEGELRLSRRLASDVEGSWIDEHGAVEVGDGHRRRDEGALREHDAAVLDVLRGDARVSRTAPKQRMTSSTARSEIGSVGEQLPLVRVAGQQRHRQAELVARRVGAAHEHRFGERDELLGRQPVAFLLDGDQLGEEVVARLVAPSGDQFQHVRLELVLRGVDHGQVVGEVVVEDPQHVGRPAAEQRQSLARCAEQLADDGDRVGIADVGHDVRLPCGGDRVDQLVDDRSHERPQPVGVAGRERRPTRRRRRVCSSPSADRIDVRWRERNSGSVIPASSMIIPAELCHRLSRSTATTSA